MHGRIYASQLRNSVTAHGPELAAAELADY